MALLLVVLALALADAYLPPATDPRNALRWTGWLHL